MNQEDHKMLMAMQDLFEKLLSGKRCDAMDAAATAPEWQKLIGQANQLIQNINEMNHLAIDLSEGMLKGPLPARDNYMSGPLKQLHSQLSVLTQSGKQLKEGYVVSKLETAGELYDMFNGLIDWVADASIRENKDASLEISAPVSSWRYHQILQALDLLHILVLEVDFSGHVVYSNRPAKQMLGDIEYIYFQQAQNNVLLTLIAELGKLDNFPVFREVYDDRNNTWYRIMSNRCLLTNGQVLYLYVIEDVSDWKTREHRLQQTASTDTMTGAYNREAGLKELEKTLLYSDATSCLAFIDIDGLKAINDTFGHDEGDYVIKNIAKVILNSIRSSDVVCRYGGDEFFIIFKKCMENTAEKIIVRMFSELKKLESTTSKPYALSFSHGILSFNSGSGYSTADLLQEADRRMYACKKCKKKERI
jgi:diguanylate cyclase (GGDEF)-like protein